jgi:hypothetical protein
MHVGIRFIARRTTVSFEERVQLNVAAEPAIVRRLLVTAILSGVGAGVKNMMVPSGGLTKGFLGLGFRVRQMSDPWSIKSASGTIVKCWFNEPIIQTI